MIPDQLVRVFIQRKTQFKQLGLDLKYFDTFCHKYLWVPWQKLQSKSCQNINVICDRCSKTYSTRIMRARGRDKHYCSPCSSSITLQGNTYGSKNKGKSGLSGEQSPKYNKNLSPFMHFKHRVVFLIRKLYEEHKSLINPEDLPIRTHKNTDGYLISFGLTIREAFNEGFTPEEFVTLERAKLISRDEYTAKISGKNNHRWKANKEKDPDFTLYQKITRNLTSKNYRRHKSIINPYDLPRSKRQYHVDHIVSVKTGFENGILPYIIASVENLQMLPSKDNYRKNKKSCPEMIEKLCRPMASNN